MDTIGDHPKGTHPLAVSLAASDTTTLNMIPHRKLTENGHSKVFLDFMVHALHTHHISPEAFERRKDMIRNMGVSYRQLLSSPYPRDPITQKGNFAEVFLAEYLNLTAKAQLPVYKLRYNPNVEQSMKGDDVILFDLDSDPIRIIVGEAKFRKTPSKQAVIHLVEGLLRSHSSGLPVSLMFVANRLFEEGKEDMGKKVQDCAILFLNNKLRIDYVGLLMSNTNTESFIQKNTTNNLRNLLMISLGLKSPELTVNTAFEKLELSL